MSHHTLLASHLLTACIAYAVGTASPGPSNLAILSIAATQGRRAALCFAAGVMSGSCFWAVLATFGLSAALSLYSGLLDAVRVCGGLYLLWLACKAGHAALHPSRQTSQAEASASRWHTLYLRGVLLHLTNPKAIMVWLSVIALAAPGHGGLHALFGVTGACLAIGVTVFGTYAVLFSSAPARRAYARARRILDGCLACAFAYAGLRLLGASR